MVWVPSLRDSEIRGWTSQHLRAGLFRCRALRALPVHVFIIYGEPNSRVPVDAWLSALINRRLQLAEHLRDG